MFVAGGFLNPEGTLPLCRAAAGGKRIRRTQPASDFHFQPTAPSQTTDPPPMGQRQTKSRQPGKAGWDQKMPEMSEENTNDFETEATGF